MDDPGEQPHRAFWSGLKKKLQEAVAKQEAAIVLGKVAGKTVTDDEGRVIVEAGHVIDERSVEHAAKSGKLHALAAAAATALAQDLKEKAQETYIRTDEGREARSLDTVEDALQARAFLGRVLSTDVTDIRGNVIVPAGKPLEEADIRAAREAGQLQALIYVAKQSPSGSRLAQPSSSPSAQKTPSHQSPPEPPKPLPLVLPPKDPHQP
ncbi:MAG: hypothetical protein ACP5VE_11060 [Chthonomonadales bacterium]